MPKHKTLIVFAVVIAFSFSLFGCGLLNFRSAGPEDVTGTGDDLPEWLLLAHRSTEGPDSERDDEILELDDDESDSAMGGSDEDDGVVVSAANQGSTQSSTPAQQTSQPAQTNTGSNEPQPGTMEYLKWMKDKQKLEAARKKAAAAAEDKTLLDGFFDFKASDFGGN